jgi:hypothetical protein
MKRTTWIFVVLLTLPSARAENLVFPQDIRSLLVKNGCHQVTDFFENRETAKLPPYVLNPGALAAWCTDDLNKIESDRSYTLIVEVDNKTNPLSNCTGKITGFSHIGELSFIDINEPAEWYYFVESRKRIPLTGKFRTKGIHSEYDGVGENFVCIAGKWAYRAFD